MRKQSILLIEPAFPTLKKSKNHSNFLPIGLLKLASYYRQKSNSIELLRGKEKPQLNPDKIFITSLFTYWSKFVKDTVQYYKNLFPKAKIIVGGIYATLMPDHCKEYTGCDNVFIGQHKGADQCNPAYDLIDVDYQIIQGMRGCTKKCLFCGIWKIESPSFKTAKQIEKEIQKNKLVFYDNNMLLNPNIEKILNMLANKLINSKPIKSECQSGFDGRILEEKPLLGKMLKEARFENIRIAWDFKYEEYKTVKKWINILTNAGFNPNKIFIFMIYNWNYNYKYMEKKRKKCYEWGVQIADCRFRPLNQTFDYYFPHKKNQTSKDYYIHPEWTDELIKKFRRNVRKHNICIRYNIPWNKYAQKLERINSKKMIKNRISA